MSKIIPQQRLKFQHPALPEGLPKDVDAYLRQQQVNLDQFVRDLEVNVTLKTPTPPTVKPAQPQSKQTGWTGNV